MAPILHDFETNIADLIDGIRDNDSFNLSWGDTNEPDFSKVDWVQYGAQAVVEWSEEENLDDPDGAHAGAYTNVARYNIRVRVPVNQELDKPIYNARLNMYKALDDLKRLMAENDSVSDTVCHIQYMRSYRGDETQGNVHIPYEMVTEWEVRYIQDRTSPETSAP